MMDGASLSVLDLLLQEARGRRKEGDSSLNRVQRQSTFSGFLSTPHSSVLGELTARPFEACHTSLGFMTIKAHWST
ncbi:hypothetical protein SRHO_G00313880 [Serrasalmus rhombeus]